MNAVNLYISACRLVMQADPNNRDTYAELYKLLPYLRQSLTCTVCGRILKEPFTPTETSCQHHVCKICIGGKKRLKPSCSWCKDYETYTENTQMVVVIKCYKKLCSYLKATCMYRKLSSIINNGGNCNLTDIIDEAVVETDNNSKALHIGRSSSFDNNSAHNCSYSNVKTNLSCPEAASTPLTNFNVDKRHISDDTTVILGTPPITTTATEPCDDHVNVVEEKFNVEDTKLNFELNIGKNERNITFNLEKNFSNGRKCASPLLTVDSSAISNDLDLGIPVSDSCDSKNIDLPNLPVVLFSEAPDSSSNNYCNNLVQSPSESYISRPSCESVTVPSSPLSVTVSPLSPKFVTTVTTTTLTTSVTVPSTPDYQNVLYRHSGISSIEIICTSSDSLCTTPLTSVSPSSTKSFSRSVTQVFDSVNIPVISTIPSNLQSNDSRTQDAIKIELSPVSSAAVYPVITISEPVKVSSSSYYQDASTINNVMSPLDTLELPAISNSTTSAVTCVFNVSPGTIFSSTNMKHPGRESLIKHGTPLSNGSSMYSVMYSNSESTKITIKRKPPDIENIKKLPLEKDIGSIPVPFQDAKKAKPKPKPKPKRKGCRCGNATPTPGKLTCCGQRCPCYVEAKACIECQCRGCRNPHRPGGKKVRPIIPQLGNIQIHQVQPVHSRVSTLSASNAATAFHPVSVGSMSAQTPNMTTSGTSQTIRAVHAMHAVQAVHGVGQLHSVPGGVHQLINIGGGIMDSALTAGLNTELTLKPVNFALSSIPAQLLIHDDKSNSNSPSDNSDIDIDI